MTSDDCNKALCYRIVAARGEVMEKGHNQDGATYGRDALAKVYLCLYLYLYLYFITMSTVVYFSYAS